MKKYYLITTLLIFGACRFALGQTISFAYTGAAVNYVVPPGVTGICYTVCGAQGMGNAANNLNGGLGGKVVGILSVVPGQVLQINVGNGGVSSNAGGFNGGANGGVVACCANSNGGGGGGASDIRILPYTLNDRVVVGGGGGGTGGNRNVGCAPGCGGGGGGGWYGGGGGGAYGGSPGFGGTQAAGGLGGASCCGCPLAPQPGAAGVFGGGGLGGGMNGCNNQAANNPGCNGGVGGALIGGQGPNCTGGTGCPSTWAGASGAGGSNFGIAASNPTHTAGFQAGNGIVILNPNCCAAPSLTITATPTAVCLGQSTTLTATGALAGGTYTWLPSNIQSSTCVVSPTATTVYTVQGATAASSCQGTQTVQIVINPSPIVTVNNPTACVNGNIVFAANGGTAYSWVGPLAYASAVQNPTITNALPTQSGNYTVTATSALGCTASAVSSVTIAPAPNVTAIGGNTLCSQNTNGSTNTVVIIANGANSYVWNLPVGYNAFPNINSATFTLTPAVTPVTAISNLTVVGTGALGCTNTAVFTVTVYPNPIVLFAPLTPSMCYGASGTITATGASQYTWFPSNTLNTNTGSVVIGTPTITTVYSIIGYDLGCFSATTPVTLQVVANPTVFITPPTNTVCLGSSISLNGIGATTYSWSPANSLDNTSTPFVVATPTANTLYTLIGTLNTCTAIATKLIATITLPSLQASSSRSLICEGDVVTINANGANSYIWSSSIGGIINSNSNFISVSPVVSTIYNLTGSNGLCSSNVSVAISVVPLPILNLSTSNNQVCQGNSTTIFASGSQSFTWAPLQSINLLNANTASVNPSTSTNYTVIAINSSGTLQCSVTKEIEIDVVPQVTATISNSVAICDGQSAKLVAGGSNAFAWTPTLGLNTSIESIVYANPKSTTVYTANVSTGGFCGATATVLVKVNPTPTISVGPDLIFNLDEPMYINAVGSGTLTWISGEKILCASCPSTQILPTTSGCYKAQALNQFGCLATDELCVDITTDYNMYIPNIFTPNADGKNDAFIVYGTGITKIEISIFDRWGEKLYTTTDAQKGWDGTVKGVLSKEDTYTYVVNFTALDGKTHTKTGHVTLMK